MEDNMRKFIIALLLVTTISCGHRARNDRNAIDGIVTAKEILDLKLRNAVAKLIGDTAEGYGIDSSSLSESCLTIQFTDSCGEPDIFFSDSLVTISYYVCEVEYPMYEYKGILTVDNYNIAIFDKNNVGLKYYNTDSLVTIPIDKFECYSMSLTSALVFYMKGDSLRYWNP